MWACNAHQHRNTQPLDCLPNLTKGNTITPWACKQVDHVRNKHTHVFSADDFGSRSKKKKKGARRTRGHSKVTLNSVLDRELCKRSHGYVNLENL